MKRRAINIACTALIMVFILGFVCNPAAQEKGSVTGKEEETLRLDRKEIIKRLDDLLKEKSGLEGGKDLPTRPGAESTDPMLPMAPPGSLKLDSDTEKEYLGALRGYYTYHKAGLKHRGAVFEWQLFSSKVIFVAVLILVFAGIYFAAVQFHVGLSRKHPGKPSEGEGMTELSASLKGIKVSSPVLGVVILIISLLFFYLYLVFVYPIREIF